MVETRDALGNRVTVDANDYRVLQPRLVSDPNRNQTEVAFDTLGMVVGTAVMGKPLPAPVEGDSLTGFVADLTQAQLDASSTRPTRTPPRRRCCSDATTRIVYDLDRFRRTRQANPNDPTQWQPACAATLARETHVQRPAAAAGPEDPAQLLLLRRLRPRDPEEDPGRARAARRRRPGRQSALGRQRLDHLQQQGQAGPPVRALLQRDPPLRVRRARSASARCCSTTRPSASSPRCTRTTPTRRWCSTPGSRPPTTSTTPARPAQHRRPATRAPTPTSAATSRSTSRHCRPARRALADLARAAHRRRARPARAGRRNRAPQPTPTRPPPRISTRSAAPS